MSLTESIFREYDIRGIADTELQDSQVTEIAHALGQTFSSAGSKVITLGCDARSSSPRIVSVFRDILPSWGLDVVDIGLVPSPVLYFDVFHHHRDGGVMITASHNPGEYNGVKVMVGHQALFGEAIRDLYRLALSGPRPPAGVVPGTLTDLPVLDEYYQVIHNRISLRKPLKVVVDAGNGTGGITAPTLYHDLGARVTPLFCDVDGTFPNHHPDPTKEENLKDLVAEVARQKADLGIAFDGDADRIGVVSASGRIIWGDQLTLIFATDILTRRPGATIISEVKASEVLYDEVERLGGKPLMWKTGHSLIKQKIVETGAALAGEMSGHIFFNDEWFGFDDAVYAGARLLELLGRSPETLDQMLDRIPRVFNTPEIRVDTTEEAKFAIVDGIRSHFEDRYPVQTIDGARIRFPEGWALVRASNTQPSLVVRYEARTPHELEEIRQRVEPVLNRLTQELGHS